MIRIRSRFALSLLCIFMLFGFASRTRAQSTRSGSQDATVLVDSVRSFLDVWLIKRDISAAMQHVSPTPILGACARGSANKGNGLSRQQEPKATVKWILRRAASIARKRDTLSTAIQPVEITPTGEQNVANEEPFVLFSLTQNYKDARFVCKFAEDNSFRQVFAKEGIWYAVFRLKTKSQSDLSWILAWRKEGGEWRLFSLAPLED